MRFIALSEQFPEWLKGMEQLQEPNKCEENYIEKHGLKADFKHWAKMPSWTYGEAAMLFAGISPVPMFFDFDLTAKDPMRVGHLGRGLANAWPRFRKMNDDFHIFERGTLDDSIVELATPAYWCVRAIEFEIAIPYELWDEVMAFRERKEEQKKIIEAKAKEIEKQRQGFQDSRSDLQDYLVEIAIAEPDVKTGDLLKRFAENIPDCIEQIEWEDKNRVQTYIIRYVTKGETEKEMNYKAFYAALGRAKEEAKKR